MAFNPLGTFHKNKKFWMAGILIVCMISFVFCTGRGDLSERISRGWQREPAVAEDVGGHRVTSKELGELKQQRILANMLMMRSADVAFKKLSFFLTEQAKNPGKDKDRNNREKELQRLHVVRMSIADRKSKPQYFDIGNKFDDLLEFKLWQAEADRLGIYLVDDYVSFLYKNEFFVNFLYEVAGPQAALTPEDMIGLQRETARNFPNASDAYVRNAIAQEFRVRIAQYAVLGMQPGSIMQNRQRDNERSMPKFSFQDTPDEIRAPMSPMQLWEAYKSKRSQFDVTLIPVHVQDFVKQIKAPDEAARKDFFDKAKNKSFDPSSPEWGLVRPAQVKIEYVLADPESPAYSDTVKAVVFDDNSGFAANAMQSPLLTAANYVARSQAYRLVQEAKYGQISKIKEYRLAAPYSERDCLSPILAWHAKGHPEAGASVVGRTLLSPTDPFGAVAGYLAWGASAEVKAGTHAEKDPKTVVERQFQPNPAVNIAARSEMERRAPLYRSLMLASSSGFPLDMAGPFLAMDPVGYQQFGEFQFGSYFPPFLTVETVSKEVQEILVRQAAEEWAHENIRKIKKALEKSTGQDERFKRDLNKFVPELKLTYGPPDDKKGVYYSRYTIDKAPELAPLKKAFEKYVDMINYSEGRDVTPDAVLKPGDFYKLFFDPTESFCASSNYRAMPWPPKVKVNSARAWKPTPDPRLIDQKNFVERDLAGFMHHLGKQDPNRPPTEFEGLFENAEKPILFWRTGEVAPHRYADLSRVEKELRTVKDELKQTAAKIKQEKDADKLEALHKAEADFKQTEIDLKQTLQSVDDGWKFEQARETKAFAKAADIARELVKSNNDPNLINQEAANLTKLNRALITLPDLSPMHQELVGNHWDYAAPPLPKNTFDYPRDDMMTQMLSLNGMKEPIKIDYKELDEINRELFNQVAKEKKASNFVQILTNKPRSVFYIAVITRQPHAELYAFAKGAIANAPFPQLDRQGRAMMPQDLFMQRAQQEFAKSYRKELVDNLKKALGYSGIDEAARKSFDGERGGGD